MVCGCLDKPVATCSELLLRVGYHENQPTLNIFRKASYPPPPSSTGAMLLDLFKLTEP